MLSTSAEPGVRYRKAVDAERPCTWCADDFLARHASLIYELLRHFTICHKVVSVILPPAVLILTQTLLMRFRLACPHTAQSAG
jgi:hypothetical protein